MKTKLRYFNLIILILGLSANTSLAQQQCVIELTNELKNCFNPVNGNTPTELYLGDDLDVTGGVEPYTYSWSATVNEFDSVYTASDLLDDTTSSNPEMTFRFFEDEQSIEFHLTVTDSNNNTCRDTVTVYTSVFYFNMRGYKAYTIERGDSILLTGTITFSGGVPPVDYTWTPDHNIIDNDDNSFLAFPDSTTFYDVKAVDSIGCVVEQNRQYKVGVAPVSVNEHSVNENTEIYPNPATDQIRISRPAQAQPADYRLIKINGKEERAGRVTSAEDNIDVSDLDSGVYLLIIESDEEQLTQKVMIK